MYSTSTMSCGACWYRTLFKVRPYFNQGTGRFCIKMVCYMLKLLLNRTQKSSQCNCVGKRTYPAIEKTPVSYLLTCLRAVFKVLKRKFFGFFLLISNSIDFGSTYKALTPSAMALFLLRERLESSVNWRGPYHDLKVVKNGKIIS